MPESDQEMDTLSINPKQPNIVLILADDMGFSDLGCMGSEIRTPHLDSLARDGMCLTQMLNNARCCPSRASLLTGLYPHQTGVGHMLQDLGHPSYSNSINDQCVTLAETLGASGYRTYLAGKWHLGGRPDAPPSDDWKPGKPGRIRPIDRGFDEHYGILGGFASYYFPHDLVHNNEWIRDPGPDYNFTDAITDESVRMLKSSQNSDDPFFLFVSHIAPHWPLHAQESDIEPYLDTYRAGWDTIRERRFAKMKHLGVIDESFDLSLRDASAPPWEDVEHKEWEARRMAVYAAQVSHMDTGVGRILAALDEYDLADNTIVMFLSDNGGCAELLYEDGFLANAIDVTRDGRPVRIGNKPTVMPGPEDTFMSYGLPWANVSNAPFRLYKHWVHEGGVATPMLIRWPGMVPSGTISHEPCHLIDIMPTIVEATGTTYPHTYNGESIAPVSGESLLSLLRGVDWKRTAPIVWEHEGNRAVRDGKWKLVARYPLGWELYDMETDRTELNDLSATHPGLVERLNAIYVEWAERTGVVSWDIVSEWLVSSGMASREQIERWTKT